MKLFISFCKQQYYSLTAYRTSFWMTIFNTFIRIYAYSMLWMALYRQNSSVFGVGLSQMLIYSTASIALSQAFTWWSGPHIYVESYVKNGKIILDLLKPVDFEHLLFFRGLSETLINFCFYTIPTFLLASIILKVKIFNSLMQLLLFMIAVSLGYLILFLLNYLLALLSFVTLDLDGYLHAYHGIIAFCSGQVVPLWLYPSMLRKIIDVLPFKGVFYIPLSVLIGDIKGIEFVNAVFYQIFWIFILFIIGRIAWNSILKKIVIQGG